MKRRDLEGEKPRSLLYKGDGKKLLICKVVGERRGGTGKRETA